MAETLDQIGAAIPSLRLGRIGLELAGSEIDQIPGGRCRAPEVEREIQLICSNLVAHRLERAQKAARLISVRTLMRYLADHLPGDHIAITAVYGVGEKSLLRVLQQLLE